MHVVKFNGRPSQILNIASDVRRIAGPVTDYTVAAVLKLGASAQELEIAVMYAQGDGDVADRAGHALTGKIAQIHDLLARDETSDE